MNDEPSVDRAVRALVRLFRLLERADAGVSLAQFRILELVSRGTERSTHIASRLATSKPAITVIVDGLVHAGLLSRGTDDEDRRVIRLALTPQGRRALARAERTYRERLAPLLGEVSDAAALLAQLAEIDQAMDERWAGSERRARHATPATPTRSATPATPSRSATSTTPEAPGRPTKRPAAKTTPAEVPTTR